MQPYCKLSEPQKARLLGTFGLESQLSNDEQPGFFWCSPELMKSLTAKTITPLGLSSSL